MSSGSDQTKSQNAPKTIFIIYMRCYKIVIKIVIYENQSNRKIKLKLSL